MRRLFAYSLTLACAVLPVFAHAAVTVKKGDTLYSVARRSGVSVAQLRARNHLSSNTIVPGQVLKTGPLTPTQTGTAAKAKKPQPVSPQVVAKKSVPATGAGRYTVKPGDSLSAIARRAGVSVAALQASSHLSSTFIKPGQVLQVPARRAPSTSARRAPQVRSAPPGTEWRTVYTYTNVGARDTFKVLSLRSGLGPAQLMRLNHFSVPWVYPGMKVLLPQRVAVPIPPKSQRPPARLLRLQVRGVGVQVVQVDLRHKGVLVSAVLPTRGLGSGARVSTLARSSGAVAVINGSYFHPQSYAPAGDLVVQGRMVSWGRIPAALSITPDNRAHIGAEVGAGQWRGMETVVASGPQLLRAGAVMNNYSSVFRDPAVFGAAPRSALGLSTQRDLMLVTTSAKLSVSEMAKVMQALGAREALLLDGGSSTGLAWNGAAVQDSVRSVAYGIGVFLDYQGRRYSRS